MPKSLRIHHHQEASPTAWVTYHRDIMRGMDVKADPPRYFTPGSEKYAGIVRSCLVPDTRKTYTSNSDSAGWTRNMVCTFSIRTCTGLWTLRYERSSMGV